MNREPQVDLFVSYASEDRAFVRSLVDRLRARSLTVWFDEYELIVGRSLREQLDSGLRRSRFGVVVLSRNFFAKSWTRIELDGLVAMSDNYERVIPVWLDVNKDYVASQSPTLAGRLAVVAQSDGVELPRSVEAIQRAVEQPYGAARAALSPLSILSQLPENLTFTGVAFGEGFARREVKPSRAVRQGSLTRLMDSLAEGKDLSSALTPKLVYSVLTSQQSQLPRDFVAGLSVGSDHLDDVVLSVYTDNHYLQSVARVQGRTDAYLYGRLGRRGVAEFVTPDGELRGHQRYGHLGLGDPHLFGPLALLFATGFRGTELVARSSVLVCCRRGLRLPTDRWIDPTGRPLWNTTDRPVPDRRFAFESASSIFPSSELFTVDYSGNSLRQVTHGSEPADNSLSDDELGWVFRWETETSFLYSAMRDGRHHRSVGVDE